MGGKNGRDECKKCRKERNKCREDCNKSPDDCNGGAMAGNGRTIADHCAVSGEVRKILGAKSVQSSAMARQWLPRIPKQRNNTPDGGLRGAMG